jgi:predicted RNA-binding protein with PUA-like domain
MGRMNAMAKPRGQRFWLLKTEPSDYSIDDLERDAGTVWDGVSNNAALKHIREVAKGDRALVYHTGGERAAVGIARVTSDPYPDPRGDDPRLVVFDVEPERRLPEPVTLAAVKAEPAFEGFDLVRLPRLSVMPVPPEHWRRLLKMGGL